MNEELLATLTPLKAAGKGARGRQAARRQPLKGGKFADALAALASGGRNVPAKGAHAPASKPAAAAVQPALPATQPSPAGSRAAAADPRAPVAAAPARKGNAPAPAADDESTRTEKGRTSARRRVAQADAPAAHVAPAPETRHGTETDGRDRKSGAVEAAAGTADVSRKERKHAGQPERAAAEPRKGHGASRRQQPAADELAEARPAVVTDAAGIHAASALAGAVAQAAGQAGQRPQAAAPIAGSSSSATDPDARKAHRTEKISTAAGAAGRPAGLHATPDAAAIEARAPHAAPRKAHEADAGSAATTVARPGAGHVDSAVPSHAARRTAHAKAAVEPRDAAPAIDPLAAPDAAHPDEVDPATRRPAAGAPGAAADARGRGAARPEEAGRAAEPSLLRQAVAARAESARGVSETAHADRPSTLPSFAARPAEPAAANAVEPGAAADKAAHPAAAAKPAAAESAHARENVTPAAPAAPGAGRPAGDGPDLRQPGGESAPAFVGGAHPAPRPETPFTVGNAADAAAADAPDFAPLHAQVAMRLATLPDGAHEVALTLSPEQLGRLQIDLKLSGGRMDATVRAENPEAREALLRDLPALREALASNGIVLSSFDVSLSGHGSSAEQQAPRQAAGWETGQGHRPRRESEQDASNPGFRPDRGTSRADSAGAAGGHWIA